MSLVVFLFPLASDYLTSFKPKDIVGSY